MAGINEMTPTGRQLRGGAQKINPPAGLTRTSDSPA